MEKKISFYIRSTVQNLFIKYLSQHQTNCNFQFYKSRFINRDLWYMYEFSYPFFIYWSVARDNESVYKLGY